jgi:plasmid maintenance system antidote protein VapI
MLRSVKTLDQALSEFLKEQKGNGSYAVLAGKIGIAESTVYRLITGEQSATLTRVEQILRALGKSPQEIFGEETTRRRTRRG